MQQAITWAYVDPDLCHHILTLGHKELKLLILFTVWYKTKFGSQNFSYQNW